MPLSQSYYESLKTKAEADAKAKEDAFQAAFNRATAVEFDESGKIKTDAQGNPVYKKDDSGTTQKGTLDVQYENQKRSTTAGAEATGMLSSGQVARARIEDLGTYRANLMGAMGEMQAGLSGTKSGLARQLAEYEAQYGTPASSGSSSSGPSTSSSGTSNTSAGSTTPVAAPPTYNAPVAGNPMSTGRGSGTTGVKFTTAAKPKPVAAPKPITKKPKTIILRPGGKS